MTTVTVQKTNIAPTVRLVNGMRQIARKSNGDIVALIQQSGGVCFPWISTDEGTTWTQGDTDLGYAATDGTDDGVFPDAGVSLAVDSNDVFHACGFDSAVGNGVYDQFTISGAGTVTMNVTNETVDGADSFQWGEIVIDGSDVPWIFGGFGRRDMGTTYRNLRLYNRSGGGWSTLTNVESGSPVNFRWMSAGFDAVGDLHLVYSQPFQGEHRKYDVSAGSLSTDRNVGFSRFHGHFVPHGGTVYVVNEERFSTRDISGTFFNQQQFYSHLRFFSNDDGNYRSTIGVMNDQIYVFKPFEFSDIVMIHGHDVSQTFSGLRHTEPMVGTEHEMSVAWAQYNHHQADRGSLDCLAYDRTNGRMYYLQYRPAGGQRRTDGSGVVQTLQTGEMLTSDFDGTRDRFWLPFGFADDDVSVRTETFAWNPIENELSKKGFNDDIGITMNRESGAAVGYETEVFYIGGIRGGGGSPTDDVLKYQPWNATWNIMSSLPTRRRYLSCEEINGFIYAIGGEGPSFGSWTARNDRYEIATNTWTTTPTNLSTARQIVASENVDDIIYLISGYNGSFLNIMESYDPVTDSYTTLTSKPTAAAIGGSAVVDGVIYCFGGVGSGGHLNTHEAYDIASDTWDTTVANLPGDGRGYMFSFSHDGLVHSVGGFRSSPSLQGYARHDVYDPVTDTWDTVSYPDLPYAMANSTGTKIPVRG